jgi:hypothetical protein
MHSSQQVRIKGDYLLLPKNERPHPTLSSKALKSKKAPQKAENGKT